MKYIDLNSVKDKFLAYFDLSGNLVPQAEAEQEIREGVSFRGINILILIVAIFIASLGLNVNSTAVIIGAMLISPLMGPIIGIGLAVGIQDFELMKRSFRNLLMAAAFSMITSCVYFMISPVNEGHSELLARTSPTIYDVLIGFFGGTAGILAIGSRVKGNVIPGVAIATALMPPLCTAGYGLATLQTNYFFGAIYLFFINSVFIACATTVGVKLMKYSIKDQSNPARSRRVRQTVYTIAVLTMIPAGYMTYVMYTDNAFQADCRRFVNEQFDFPDTQVLGYKAMRADGKRTLTVTLMGRTVNSDSLTVALTDKMPMYNISGTSLRIIQGDNTRFDPTQTTSTMLRDMYQITQATIQRQQETIDSLQAACAVAARNDTISSTITPEVRVLFPQVMELAVTRGIASDVATGRLDTLNIVLVQYRQNMPQAQAEKFRQYLEARLRVKPITIVATGALSDAKKESQKKK